MRRRQFLTLVGQATLVWPLRGWAQQGDKIPRVGVIVQGDAHLVGLSGLRKGLRELGTEEGRHLSLTVRDTQGNLKAAEVAAAELERDGVAVIVSFGMSPTLAVKRATTTVAMVYVGGTDPVAGGLANSVAKPGGRVTGVHHLQAELTGKRLELFRELVPTLRRVAIFYNPNNPIAQSAMSLARDAARLFGLELVERQVTSPEQIRQEAEGLDKLGADGYYFISDATVIGQQQIITDAANRVRLPTMALELDIVRRGALAGYGLNYGELGRLAAKFVQRILAGDRPGDLPIEDITVPALGINLKTARAIGIEVPRDILARADEVIE
jgi:putative tryptophan/tyrosine transport system substrate-binding protein